MKRPKWANLFQIEPFTKKLPNKRLNIDLHVPLM